MLVKLTDINDSKETVKRCGLAGSEGRCLHSGTWEGNGMELTQA